MTETELHWLAGLLEGEGNFGIRKPTGRPTWAPAPIIQLQMADEDVVRHALAVAAVGTVGGPYHFRKHPHWRPMWAWRLSGKPALRLMDRLYPLMGERRQGQINRVRKGIVTLPLGWPVEPDKELDDDVA